MPSRRRSSIGEAQAVPRRLVFSEKEVNPYIKNYFGQAKAPYICGGPLKLDRWSIYKSAPRVQRSSF